MTVVSPATPKDGKEGEVLSKWREKKRRVAMTQVFEALRRKKIALSTGTRRWQAIRACKYIWTEGEFDSNGDLIGVLCQSCSTITGRQKVMVLKGDNLEKHEGKRTCKEDGVPFLHLKKCDTFTKLDCKHLKYYKLWAGRRQGRSVADLLVAGLEGKFRRKGV